VEDGRGFPAGNRPGAGAALTGRLRWLMGLRLAVATVMLGVTILLQVRQGEAFSSTPLRSLYFFVGLTYLLTIVYAVLQSQVRDQSRFAAAQLALDLALLSGVVMVTGGAASPFVIVYFLIIIGAAILFYRAGSLVAAGGSALLYGVAVGAPLLPRVAAVIDPTGTFGAMSRTAIGYRHLLAVFGFFLVAFLASHLTESLRRVGAQLDVASASLAALERRSEHILRNIASGLVTTDLGGTITYCNRAAERIAHLSAADVIGRPFAGVFRLPPGSDPWRRPGQLENTALRAEGGIAGSGEGPLLGMTFSALRDGEGQSTGVICAFQDLTAIRRMEEQVRRSDRLAAIGELAAGMAHEIRNPLASLSGSIAMLREELTVEGTGRELLDIVTGEVARLDALVSDFLGYASPRDIAPQETDLLAVLQETMTLLQARAGECRIAVTRRGAAPARAEVDPQLARQVFWNLALNAVEAMPRGGELAVTVSGVGPEVTIEFADTGAGIPRAALAKIFTPFFSTKERGTGLGLALVYKIVEAHRGRIDVESEPGRGTTVRVAFPVRQQAPAPVGAPA